MKPLFRPGPTCTCGIGNSWRRAMGRDMRSCHVSSVIGVPLILPIFRSFRKKFGSSRLDFGPMLGAPVICSRMPAFASGDMFCLTSLREKGVMLLCVKCSAGISSPVSWLWTFLGIGGVEYRSGRRLTLRLITGSIGIVARMDIASAAFFSALATFRVCVESYTVFADDTFPRCGCLLLLLCSVTFCCRGCAYSFLERKYPTVPRPSKTAASIQNNYTPY